MIMIFFVELDLLDVVLCDFNCVNLCWFWLFEVSISFFYKFYFTHFILYILVYLILFILFYLIYVYNLFIKRDI